MTEESSSRPDAEKSAKELATETAEAVEGRASQLKAKAEQLARDAVETGKDEVRSRADGIKNSAAGEASRTANAMRDAADRFPEGDLRGVAAAQIADGLGHVADRIRDKDLGDIPADLTAFARRNPGIFFAGAALLGFAVARMAKATADSGGEANQAEGSDAGTANYDDPWRSYDDRGAA